MFLDDLYKEYERVKLMSSEELNEEYGSYCKDEILGEFQDEIDYYERGNDVDEDDIAECNTYHLDCGFNSWRQVNEMFF